MSDTASPIVEMRGISKRYGGVQALTDVDLELYTDEVHALSIRTFTPAEWASQSN